MAKTTRRPATRPSATSALSRLVSKPCDGPRPGGPGSETRHCAGSWRISAPDCPAPRPAASPVQYVRSSFLTQPLYHTRQVKTGFVRLETGFRLRLSQRPGSFLPSTPPPMPSTRPDPPKNTRCPPTRAPTLPPGWPDSPPPQHTPARLLPLTGLPPAQRRRHSRDHTRPHQQHKERPTPAAPAAPPHPATRCAGDRAAARSTPRPACSADRQSGTHPAPPPASGGSPIIVQRALPERNPHLVQQPRRRRPPPHQHARPGHQDPDHQHDNRPPAQAAPVKDPDHDQRRGQRQAATPRASRSNRAPPSTRPRCPRPPSASAFSNHPTAPAPAPAARCAPGTRPDASASNRRPPPAPRSPPATMAPATHWPIASIATATPEASQASQTLDRLASLRPQGFPKTLWV